MLNPIPHTFNMSSSPSFILQFWTTLPGGIPIQPHARLAYMDMARAAWRAILWNVPASRVSIHNVVDFAILDCFPLVSTIEMDGEYFRRSEDTNANVLRITEEQSAVFDTDKEMCAQSKKWPLLRRIAQFYRDVPGDLFSAEGWVVSVMNEIRLACYVTPQSYLHYVHDVDIIKEIFTRTYQDEEEA